MPAASGRVLIQAAKRLTGWQLFVVALIVALGTEYWDKDALNLGGGVVVPWARFVFAMALAPLAIGALWRWSELLRVPGEMRPLLFFYAACATSIVGLLFHPRAPDGFSQYVRTLVHLSLYVFLVYVIVKGITWDRLRLLVGAYYILGLAGASLAILQFLNGAFGVLPWVAAVQFRSAEYEVGGGLVLGFRASSFFGEPSWAARYYIHWMAIACGYWWFTGRRRHLAALVLFAMAFYVANSLLGYVLLATFVLGLFATQLWRNNMLSLSPRRKAALAALAYGAVLAWMLGIRMPLPDLMDRTVQRVGLVAQGGGGSGNRWDGIFAGLEVWRRAPVFGVGLGNIEEHIVQFYQDKAYIFRSYFGSDSLYVQILAETGIVGLLAFLYFWGNLVLFRLPEHVPVASLSPGAAQAYGWSRLLQMDALAQMAGMLNYSDYLNPHFWTVVGIMLACRLVVRRELALSPSPVPAPVAHLTVAPAG